MTATATQPIPMLTDGVLRLRPWRQEESIALVNILHASMDSVGRWMDWCTPGYSDDDALRWMREMENSWTNGAGECALAIATGGEEAPVGCIAVNQFRAEHRTANIGYWIGQPHQGRGLAARALGLLAPYAFAHFGLSRLEIVAAEHNWPSRRTAEKAGARFEGIARKRLVIHGASVDAAMYSLVTETPG